MINFIFWLYILEVASETSFGRHTSGRNLGKRHALVKSNKPVSLPYLMSDYVCLSNYNSLVSVIILLSLDNIIPLW
jgi:hypothetical protein